MTIWIRQATTVWLHQTYVHKRKLNSMYICTWQTRTIQIHAAFNWPTGNAYNRDIFAQDASNQISFDVFSQGIRALNKITKLHTNVAFTIAHFYMNWLPQSCQLPTTPKPAQKFSKCGGEIVEAISLTAPPPYFQPIFPSPVRIRGSNGAITRATWVAILWHNPYLGCADQSYHLKRWSCGDWSKWTFR